MRYSSNNDGPMETEVAKKLFTVDEYLRMGEAGIFDPEARLETYRGRDHRNGVRSVTATSFACESATALFSAVLQEKRW